MSSLSPVPPPLSTSSSSSSFFPKESLDNMFHPEFNNSRNPVVADDLIIPFPSEKRGPLRVMFLSANTGGGHRASAESLIHQIHIHYPRSTCRIFDLEDVMNVFPHVQLANSYKDMTAKPINWKMFYHFSNVKAMESVANMYSKVRCEEQYIKVIASFKPDVIISVHPFLNHVPLSAVRKYEQQQMMTGGRQQRRHIPFFTVVTDLGSGYRGWFQKDVDRIYVASEKLFQLATIHYGVSPDRVSIMGLPIRKEFTQLAKEMPPILSYRKNQRAEEEMIKKTYQKMLKLNLNLPNTDDPMILVMGGGEGVGSLAGIVRELYVSFMEESINATICVVCAKNVELKRSLEETNWKDVYQLSKQQQQQQQQRQSSSTNTFSSFWNNTNTGPSYMEKNNGSNCSNNRTCGSANKNNKTSTLINVVPLGFVTRMAEYMAAASILITKAGPGTIAEASALGLPLMLTSFLPGQEAGNVDIVLEKGFGAYITNPRDIALEVTHWMKHQHILEKLRIQAQCFGHPDAASEIISDIGNQTHEWKQQDYYYNNNNSIHNIKLSGGSVLTKKHTPVLLRSQSSSSVILPATSSSGHHQDDNNLGNDYHNQHVIMDLSARTV